MKISDFDYSLPKDLIASYPKEKRENSRLLVLNRKTREIQHRYFYQIIDYLSPRDALVINNTKVFPARLFGRKENGEREIEVLLLKEVKKNLWEVLVKPSKKAPLGTRIIFNRDEISCEIMGKAESGGRLARLNYQGDLFEILNKVGKIPLPPYIKREAEPTDGERYQTVYAQNKGAVAAPTAGLHFTLRLLDKIKEMGITIIPITLHVGWGSFRPIRVNDPQVHNMESEYFEINQSAAESINQIRKDKKGLIAVGTTTVRALETAADLDSFEKTKKIKAQKGWSKKFILPPYQFKLVDSLITNFHLPRSTLLLLVSAFAGRELILKAYQEAIERKYRFYSYGDAMLII